MMHPKHSQEMAKELIWHTKNIYLKQNHILNDLICRKCPE